MKFVGKRIETWYVSINNIQFKFYIKKTYYVFLNGARGGAVG